MQEENSRLRELLSQLEQTSEARSKELIEVVRKKVAKSGNGIYTQL